MSEDHGPRVWRLRHDTLDCATGPYIERWIAETPWVSLRLHHWLHGDDHRAHHDHPWAFWTLILKGQYLDLCTTGDPLQRDVVAHMMRPGAIAYRPATYLHTVKLEAGKTCWSLVLTGPIVRRFRFWDPIKKRWWKSNKWLMEKGKFVCQ